MLLEVQPPSLDAPRFLCESSVKSRVEDVLRHVVQIHNLRMQLTARTSSNTASNPTEGAEADASTRQKRTREEAFDGAAALLSAQSVRRKHVMTSNELHQMLGTLQQCSSDGAAATVTAELVEALSERDAGLVFAGRWLEVDRPISDYVGGNEKTKVSVSLRTSDVPSNARGIERATAPAAEPITTERMAAPPEVAEVASIAHVGSSTTPAGAAVLAATAAKECGEVRRTASFPTPTHAACAHRHTTVTPPSHHRHTTVTPPQPTTA
jgi:hypothetical protein